jgi:hypothetical protein
MPGGLGVLLVLYGLMGSVVNRFSVIGLRVLASGASDLDRPVEVLPQNTLARLALPHPGAFDLDRRNIDGHKIGGACV